jgi:hypothetical protein
MSNASAYFVRQNNTLIIPTLGQAGAAAAGVFLLEILIKKQKLVFNHEACIICYSYSTGAPSDEVQRICETTA